MAKKRIPTNKFVSLFNSHSYEIVKVYCHNEKCCLVECRTPSSRKTFFVYIPKQFTLLPPDNTSTVDVVVAEDCNTLTVHYLKDIKGEVTCKLLALTETGIILESGSCYTFVDDDTGDNEDDTAGSDSISKLESLTERVAKNLGVSSALEENVNAEEFHTVDDDPEVEDKVETKDSEEIVINDDADEGNDPELEKDTAEQEKPDEQDGEDENGEEDSDFDDQDDSLQTSSGIGIPYVYVSFGTFSSRVNTFEEFIDETYVLIEKNEKSVHQTKIKKIQKMCDTLKEHLEKRYLTKQQKTTTLKEQLSRLMKISESTKEMKRKITDSDSGKVSNTDALDDIEKISVSTCQTIDELNGTLTSEKDEFTEYLFNIEITLNDALSVN